MDSEESERREMMEEEFEDDYSEEGEEFENCGGFFDRGVFVCTKVGSEECDFECPYRRDIGMTIKAIQRRDMRELHRALQEEIA
jgi:hypothetical protein